MTSEKCLKEVMKPVMTVSGGRALQAEETASAMALRSVVFEELQGGQCGWARWWPRGRAVGDGVRMCGWCFVNL